MFYLAIPIFSFVACGTQWRFLFLTDVAEYCLIYTFIYLRLAHREEPVLGVWAEGCGIEYDDAAVARKTAGFQEEASWRNEKYHLIDAALPDVTKGAE